MEAALYAASVGIIIGTIIAFIAKGVSRGKEKDSARNIGSPGGLPKCESHVEQELQSRCNSPASNLHGRQLRSHRKRPR